MKKALTIFAVLILLIGVSVGCGREDEKHLLDVPLEDIVSDLSVTLGEHYVQMPVALSEEALSNILGVNPEIVEEYAGDFSMTMTSADCFVAIKAEEGYGNEVRAALEKRRAEVEKMFQQYLPGPLSVAKAGKVLQKGDYVFLIMLGDAKNGPEKDVASAEEIIQSYFTP